MTTGIMKKLILNRMQFCVENELPHGILFSTGNKAECEVKAVGDRMIATLYKDIYGKRKLATIRGKVKVPETAFDYIKKKMGMKYKEKTIEIDIPIDIYAIFPELKGVNERLEIVVR